MSPVEKATIEERLRKLREVIGKLEEYRKVSKKDFFEKHIISDATMHNLVLGIEIIVDIGNHILSDVFQVKAAEYAEVIEKLGEVGVIPEKFAKENVDMARFRNLLIHEYIKINIGKVYQNLQKAPDIFRKFVRYYLKFLEKLK